MTYVTAVKGKKRRGNGTRPVSSRRSSQAPSTKPSRQRAFSARGQSVADHRYFMHTVQDRSLLPWAPSLVDPAHCVPSILDRRSRRSTEDLSGLADLRYFKTFDSRNSLIVAMIDDFDEICTCIYRINICEIGGEINRIIASDRASMRACCK